MSSEILSALEIDAIGEILNISLGSSATAISNLLGTRVDITTPVVNVVTKEEFEMGRIEPAVGVEITYVAGLEGSNVMLLKRHDVKVIVEMMMGFEVSDEDFVLDEINISAVCEVMNQMMGASATALSDLLGMTVDISVPMPYIIESASFGDLCEMDADETVVAVTFNLTVDGVMESEFMSVLSLPLAKTLSGKMIEKFSTAEEEEAAPAASAPAPAASPAASPAAAAPASDPVAPPMQAAPQMPMGGEMPIMQQPMYQMPPQGAYGYPNQYAAYGAYPPPAPVNVQNAQLHQFDAMDFGIPTDQKDNLKLLMGVPLEISVEIGTAKRKVKDILEFTQGTIIELERQAGAPVDIVVNGNLIARGDVVVIDDNFAVRITEIVKSKFIESLDKR